jgi:hypothetical protein
MLMEAMEDQLAGNATLPRTLGGLLFRPGHLTREYVQGRIARYIPPFRLYLISSLLFFILLPLLTGVGDIRAEMDEEMRQDSIAEAVRRDSLRAAGVADTMPDPETSRDGIIISSRAGGDRFNIQIGWDTTRIAPWLMPVARRLERSQDRLNSMPAPEAVATMIQAFIDNAPTGVFLMMPVFALILKLLYARRKRFYVEHFVFALHTHSFAFLLFTIMMVAGVDWLAALLLVWFAVYVFLAMKKVYAQGWIRTFLKYVFLSWAYMFLLVFGVGVTMILSALSV